MTSEQAMPGATPDGATTTKARRRGRKPAAPPAMRNKRGEARTGHRASGKQVDRARVAEVQDLLEMLFPESEVKRIVSEKYKVSRKTVGHDVERVKGAWAADPLAADPKAAREKAARTAMRMFRRSVGKGDDKLAQKFFQDFCRIVGAYVPDAMRLVALDTAAMSKMSEGELDAAIEAELARLGVAAKP